MQHDTLHIKLSNSLFNKLKPEVKYGTGIILSLSSNVVSSSNYETSFTNRLLLTDTQILKICKAFANGLSANIKFSKAQFPNMIQSGGFLQLFVPKLIKSIEPLTWETIKAYDQKSGARFENKITDAEPDPFPNPYIEKTAT